MIRTERLWLRPWRDDDGNVFARMHRDADVMADLAGPLDQAASDQKLERYRECYRQHGISRWAVEVSDGAFVGYAGVMFRSGAEHPFGPHYEIGWRFERAAWGRGYATEAARAALSHAFERTKLQRIYSYTAPDNQRSQAVMERLGLRRERPLDFVADYGQGPWHGLVWVVEAGQW